MSLNELTCIASAIAAYNLVIWGVEAPEPWYWTNNPKWSMLQHQKWHVLMSYADNVLPFSQLTFRMLQNGHYFQIKGKPAFLANENCHLLSLQISMKHSKHLAFHMALLKVWVHNILFMTATLNSWEKINEFRGKSHNTITTIFFHQTWCIAKFLYAVQKVGSRHAYLGNISCGWICTP